MIVAAAGDLDLVYTRVVTRRQGFEFSSRCERASHLALPMCGFEKVAALILEPVSKGADVPPALALGGAQQLVAECMKPYGLQPPALP